MEKHSLIITQKKGVNTPIALVVHSNCIMEWDIIALLLGEDNLIHNFSDFIYYGSVIRCEMYGDIPDFNNCKPSEYNKEKYRSKIHWRESTIPMSADGAVIGPIGSLYGYPCLGEETDNDEETDINDE